MRQGGEGRFPERLAMHAYTKRKGEIVEVTNSPLCCAERRLIDKMVRHAMCQGVRPHNMVAWIGRKHKDITVERTTTLGQGSSFPCCLCRKTLERLDMRVRCVWNGQPFCARLRDTDIQSKHTLGQALKTQPLKPCVIHSRHPTRRALSHTCLSHTRGSIGAPPLV